MGDWLWAIGDWLLAIGDWLLAIGDWLLAIGNRYWRLRFVVEYARSMAFSSWVLSKYCLLTTFVCTVAVKPATSKVKREEAVRVGEKAMVVVPTTESCPIQFQLSWSS